MNIHKKIIFTGRVQGVNFRRDTKEIADQLGVLGTVKNKDDGSVEVIAQGSEKGVEQMIASLRSKHSIDQVQQTTQDAAGTFSGFIIQK